MSAATPVPAPAAAAVRAWPMLRAMVGIGLVCGLAIVGSYQWSKPIIEENRAEALRAGVFQVLPGAAESAAFRFDEASGFAPHAGSTAGAELVFAAYDAQGELIGVAIEAAGMGYQDTIRFLYGYSPEKRAVVGFQVLESRETPGLGDKIGVDAEFLDNFVALDVRLTESGVALAHPLQMVRKGEKNEPWQIDAITGATVSSRAVTDILRDSAGRWVPRVMSHLEQLRREARR